MTRPPGSGQCSEAARPRLGRPRSLSNRHSIPEAADLATFGCGTTVAVLMLHEESFSGPGQPAGEATSDARQVWPATPYRPANIMTRLARVAGVFVALALLATSWPAVSAPQVSRHSGVIADVNERAGTFVLAEVGSWQLREGRTVVSHRTVELTPATAFAIAFRDEDAPSGYRNDFVEAPLEPWAVYVGDFVTVECVEQRGRLTALKVIVTDLPGGGMVEEESK